MIVGVPKEIKRDEYRVAMLPVGVEELVRAGHQVLVESGAGLGSGLTDQSYQESGAELVGRGQDVEDPRADHAPQHRPDDQVAHQVGVQAAAFSQTRGEYAADQYAQRDQDAVPGDWKVTDADQVWMHTTLS